MESKAGGLRQCPPEAGEGTLRYWSGITFGIQALLVLLLSISAVFAFSNSFVFAPLMNMISDLLPLQPIHVCLLLAALLILTGSVLVIIRKEPRVEGFVILIALFCTPALLGFSTTDWPQILGIELETETGISFGGMLSLAFLIVAGYLVLQFTSQYNRLALKAAERGCDREEVGIVYRNKHVWSFLTVVGASVVVLLLFFLSSQIENTLGENLGGMPVNILLVGILCSLVLIGASYAFLVRGRSPVQKPERIPQQHEVEELELEERRMRDDIRPLETQDNASGYQRKQGEQRREGPSEEPDH